MDALSPSIISHCNDLHETAMDIAEDAFFKQRKFGMTSNIRLLYEKAFDLELQAAILIPPGSEPSRTVMFIKAMYLANSAGLKRDALKTAKNILSFTPYQEYRRQAEKMRRIMRIKLLIGFFNPINLFLWER